MSWGDGPPASVSRLRSVAHPVRLDILSLLTGSSLSASEVARELEISQANASYHLRRLLAAGLLVIDGEVKVNGGVAKKYRHPWDAKEEGGPYPEADRLAEVRTLAEAIPRRYAHRLQGEKTPGLLSDIDTWVEPEVWSQVTELLTQASHLMHAQARPPRTEGTVRASVTLAAFRMEERR